ncbi:hypothetical protein TcCL_ESM07058 [Trypanosoma cruzi]|nr:hypothetical protein TcCL_ESM07058 [Trypanosoma cruzi]
MASGTWSASVAQFLKAPKLKAPKSMAINQWCRWHKTSSGQRHTLVPEYMLSHASLTPPSASSTGTPCIHSQNTGVGYTSRKLHNVPANCSLKVVIVLGGRGNALTRRSSSGDQRR